MKKIIENIMPMSAPWGGPESMSFLSALTSLTMHIQHYNGDEPIYCPNGQGLCYQCNRCKSTPLQRNHEALYHYHLAVSGLGVFAPHNEEKNNDYDKIAEESMPDYIDFTLTFLGYRYATTDSVEGKEKLRARIVASIDNNIPVLMKSSDSGCLWSIVTGYDQNGDILMGYDGNADLFSSDNWFDAFASAIFFEKGMKPVMSANKAISRMISVLETTAQKGDDITLAKYLQKNNIFGNMSQTELREIYDYTAAIIGYYAEARCFTGNALCNALKGTYLRIEHVYERQFPNKLELNGKLLRVAEYFQNSHDVCSWGAWKTMKYEFTYPSDETVEAFRSEDIRLEVSEYLLNLAQNDRCALKELKECI